MRWNCTPAAFESVGRLERLQAFASEHGPRFYGLPVNRGTVTLRREAWCIPPALPFGDDTIVPLAAGETLAWKFTGVDA
jgi:dihydroorotase